MFWRSILVTPRTDLRMLSAELLDTGPYGNILDAGYVRRKFWRKSGGDRENGCLLDTMQDSGSGICVLLDNNMSYFQCQ